MSDEEYVEQIRKNDRTFRRMRWWWPCLFVGTLFVLAWSGDVVRKIIEWCFPGEKETVYLGLCLGISFGLMLFTVGFQAAMCLKHWIDARSGYRTERLLLQYHDQLRDSRSEQK